MDGLLHTPSMSRILATVGQDQQINVDFDVITAGRGGTNSPIIASIMRYEVARLHPDLVSSTKARTISVRTRGPDAGCECASSIQHIRSPVFHASQVPSAGTIFGADGACVRVAIPPKWVVRSAAEAPHTLTYNLKQADPDIERHDLPFHLHRQIIDLRDMANAAGKIGAEFFLTSFVTLVHDGLLLDPEHP